MIDFMDISAWIKTFASPSADANVVAYISVGQCRSVGEKYQILEIRYCQIHKPCLVKANSPSKHVLAMFGSRSTHIPMAAMVSAANLLSGSFI